MQSAPIREPRQAICSVRESRPARSRAVLGYTKAARYRSSAAAAVEWHAPKVDKPSVGRLTLGPPGSAGYDSCLPRVRPPGGPVVRIAHETGGQKEKR